MLVKRFSLIALSVLCLVLAGVVLANPAQNYEIVRHVFGGGGDHFEQGIYSLNNTVGRSVARNYKGADTELCVGFWCQSAFEAQIPNPDFTASPRRDDAPLTVTFTDTSTYTPTQWLWHFGDGETSATQHPTHTYEVAQPYTVTLVVTNAYGSDRLVRPNYITVTCPLTGVALSERGLLKPDTTVTFTVEPLPDNTKSPYTYTVDYDDGTTPMTSTAGTDPFVLTHTYATTGTYTVEVGVWNCPERPPVTATHTITVTTEGVCLPPLGVDLSARGTMRPDNPITFTVDPKPNDTSMPYTYTIDYDDGTASMTETTSSDPAVLTHTYASTGTYTVEVGVWNCDMTTPITTTHTITITTLEVCTPITDVVLSPSRVRQLEALDARGVTFMADVMPDAATKPYTYTIDYGDASAPITSTSNSDPLTLTHAYTQGGSYTVEIGAWNCDMTTPVTDTYPIFIVEFCTSLTDVGLSTTGTLQTGSPVTFTADLTPEDATQPYTYTIDYDDASGPITGTSSTDPITLTHTYATSGTYTVEIGVWNCDMTTPVTTTRIVTITGAEVCRPLTGVDLSARGTMQPAKPITFTADLIPNDATMPYTYTIDYDDGTAPMTATAHTDPLVITHTYNTTGTYTAEIGVRNCDLTSPITNTVEIDVAPGAGFNIYLPLVVRNLS